jgi:3-dehydroquinate synthase
MSALKPKSINVSLKQYSYPILIQRDIIDNLHQLLNPFNNKQDWFLISPKPVFDIYGESIINNLSTNGFNIIPIIINDGEKTKSFNYFEKYCRQLVQHGCNRDSTLIALGGGVTGDLCGFIASSLFRGINYIQIPTSLLAMVDSSIGGKTGINIDEGKNLVGAFHHPQAVIIDSNFLISLPIREINSGLGEIIKYGFIYEKTIIPLFEQFLKNNYNLESSEIEKLIYLSASTKAKIVSKDSSEKDLRRILNFGHTVGHIIESYTNYSHISHGEAVVYGMMVALKLSIKFCNLNQNIVNDSIKVLNNISGTSLPQIPKEQFMEFLLRDKKVRNKKVNFILITKIGQPIIKNDIEPEIIYNHYEELLRSNK